MLFWKLFLQSLVFIYACVAIAEFLSRKADKMFNRSGEVK